MTRVVQRLAVTAAVATCVLAAAAIWVWLRPLVTATAGSQGVYYADDSHRAVFGSDAVFMVTTAAFAAIFAVTVLVRRGRPLQAPGIALGAVVASLSALVAAWVGSLLDGVSAGPLQGFPPAQMIQGQSLVEPARLHTPAALGAAAVGWLVVVFIAALIGRRQESD